MGGEPKQSSFGDYSIGEPDLIPEPEFTSGEYTGHYPVYESTAPKLLNDKQPFRHREWLDLVIQRVGNKPIVMTPIEYKDYKQAMSCYKSPAPLFSEQAAKDEELAQSILGTRHPVVKQMQPNFDPERREFNWESANVHELKFIMDHLPPTELDQIRTAWRLGEPVNFRLVHGAKWKFGCFSDNQVHRFDRPQPGLHESFKNFSGSNFVLFTKIGLADNHGELCVTEELLAEANVGTKQGNRQTSVKSQIDNDRIKVDRTLPGLIRRHYESDPELIEREYLCNQFKSLRDKVETTSDRKWIKKAWIGFLREQVPHGYLIRPLERSKLMFTKDRHVGVSHAEERNRLCYIDILRVSVATKGYLHEVLTEIKQRSHPLRRWEKLTDTQENIYPFFKQTFAEGGSLRVAEDIFRLPTLKKMFLTRNAAGELSNLAYLLYCFANDSELASSSDVHGQALSSEIIDSLKKINEIPADSLRLKADKSSRLTRMPLEDMDWQKVSDKVRLMLRPNYFAPLPEQASWQELVSVRGPKHGLHHQLLRPPEPKHKHLFKEVAPVCQGEDQPIKINTKPRTNREELTTAFDVQMPERKLSDEQATLADLFIDYCKMMADEGYWTTPYMVWRDNQPRRLGPKHDNLVTGRYLYNRARALFRPTGQDRNHSRLAIQQFYALASQRLELRDLSAREREEISRQLDYEAMVSAENSGWQISGKMGEIFVHMALESDPKLLFGKGVGEWRGEITFENIDRKGQKRLFVDLNGPDNPQLVIPDFMVRLNETVTGEMEEWLVEVKTYIKSLAQSDMEDILAKYQPCLAGRRRLCVIANSPSQFITPEARMMVEAIGGRIIGAEVVTEALRSIDRERYPLPQTWRGEMADHYQRFTHHPAAFAIRLEHRNLMNVYEQIATEKNPLFIDQIREQIDRLYNEENLP